MWLYNWEVDDLSWQLISVNYCKTAADKKNTSDPKLWQSFLQHLRSSQWYSIYHSLCHSLVRQVTPKHEFLYQSLLVGTWTIKRSTVYAVGSVMFLHWTSDLNHSNLNIRRSLGCFHLPVLSLQLRFGKTHRCTFFNWKITFISGKCEVLHLGKAKHGRTTQGKVGSRGMLQTQESKNRATHNFIKLIKAAFSIHCPKKTVAAETISPHYDNFQYSH